jgi:hypothetical protein
MRTKTIIDGFKNSQKFRVTLNGIMFFTTVKEMAFDLFGNTEQRVAVWDAMMALAMQRRHETAAVGLAGTWRGYDVQVDLI